MKNNLRALLPLMIILIVAVAAQEPPTRVDFRSGAEPRELAEFSLADSLAPSPAESLAIVIVEKKPSLMERSKIAAHSLAITLRVGKRLLGTWLDTLLSSPTRKG